MGKEMWSEREACGRDRERKRARDLEREKESEGPRKREMGAMALVKSLLGRVRSDSMKHIRYSRYTSVTRTGIIDLLKPNKMSVSLFLPIMLCLAVVGP